MCRMAELAFSSTCHRPDAAGNRRATVRVSAAFKVTPRAPDCDHVGKDQVLTVLPAKRFTSSICAMTEEASIKLGQIEEVAEVSIAVNLGPDKADELKRFAHSRRLKRSRRTDLYMANG
jgi:hypothetical protein